MPGSGFAMPRPGRRLPKIDVLSESIRARAAGANCVKPDEWATKLYSALHREACASFAKWALMTMKNNPGIAITESEWKKNGVVDIHFSVRDPVVLNPEKLGPTLEAAKELTGKMERIYRFESLLLNGYPILKELLPERSDNMHDFKGVAAVVEGFAEIEIEARIPLKKSA
jgi:hypothetical protein